MLIVYMIIMIHFLSLPTTINGREFHPQQDEIENNNENRKKQRKQTKGSTKRKMTKEERQDSRIVQRILLASRNGEHYKVLGLKLYEIKVPFEVRIPFYRSLKGLLRRKRNKSHDDVDTTQDSNTKSTYISIFRPNNNVIKRAYRQRARLVHPDKNTDPNAAQAFDALDQAAAILMDERLRNDYDMAVRNIRERRAQERIQLFKNVIGVAYSVSSKVSSVGKRVLGPFLTPLIVLGALII